MERDVVTLVEPQEEPRDQERSGHGGGEPAEVVLGEEIPLENTRGQRSHRDKPFEAIIKLSPSDLEMSGSDDGHGMEVLLDDDEIVHQIKKELESEFSDNGSANDDDLSVSWAATSEEEVEEKVKPMEKRKLKKERKKKGKDSDGPPKPKRSRGRPKQPRRLEGVPDDYTSEEDKEDANRPVLKPGSGYPPEFKLRVLKYAETHSNAATGDKFGLQAKRIRDWKKSKSKIEMECEGSYKRRPRTDGYTVEEKLQAVIFASERSVDEARLLYNVDRRTIEKWKARKEQFEQRLLQGEGNYIRRTGSGRKPLYTPIEESLRDWIVALRLKGVTLNHRMILHKAKKLIEEDSSLDLPVPRTRTWVVGFLKRQNLHGLLGNTLGHEDPHELLNVDIKTSDGDIKSLVDKLVEIPENPNKRNRRTISLEDKVNIIKRIEQGETQGTVAKSLRVATSTIQGIWSCRHEILNKYHAPKARTKSDALIWKTYSAIGSALKDWLEQNSFKLPKVDVGVLMEKAVQLSETYRLPLFPGDAKQWLRIFCKRNSLPNVLVELRGNYGGGSSTANQVPPTTQSASTNANSSINSVDSSDHPTHHDDDFHSDFNFNEIISAIQNDPHQRLQNPHGHPPSSFHHHHHHPTNTTTHQHQVPTHSHSATSLAQPHSHRFATLGVSQSQIHHVSGQPVTNSDAIKCVSLLRSWIQSNYGANEEYLNNHLSAIENIVLSNRKAIN